MIIGIGVDTVEISRFETLIAKTPRLKSRLFTVEEQSYAPRSLAARFAAKEALIKAMGGSDGISWWDLEVLKVSEERPEFSLTPGLTVKLDRLGAAKPHLSMTHDGDMATAFVILEKR